MLLLYTPLVRSPPSGYLFGFVAAAAFVGRLADRGWGRPAGRVFVAMLAGSAIIYLFGVGWLTAFVGMETALALGAVPFVRGDVLKAVLAAAVLPVAWRIGRGSGRERVGQYV